MIDEERTTTESDEQADGVQQTDSAAAREDSLKDLEVSTDPGADVKGGARGIAQGDGG